MAGVVSLLLALTAQAAASPPPPPGAENLPARAVDHVVVLEERRADCSNCPLHRRTIARSGSWVKDERIDSQGSRTIYSDFASGTSFTLYRNRDGAVAGLVVERNFEPDGRYGIRRQSTGDRDVAAGEPCAVWTQFSAVIGTETKSCETADGILVRTRHLGRVIADAVSVERRPVRPEEARPPADLFAMVRWPRFDRPEGMGYEVVLTSRSRGTERTSVLRRQGRLTSSRREGRRDEGLEFSASDGVTSYSYQVDPRGRAVRLNAGLPRLRISDIPSRWEAVPGRRVRRVLGEPCTWQINAAFQSTDTHYQCRTADGVPLMLEDQWHWDSIVDVYTARRLTRRPLTEVDIAPPAAADDWATWGVTPPTPSAP